MNDKPFYAYKDDELVPVTVAKEAIRNIIKERDEAISAYRDKALELACTLQRKRCWCMNTSTFNKESRPCQDIIEEVDE